jgi:uncharacterized protein
MRNKIIEICKDIEEEYGIRILFCVENGSRAWGMESKNSDYDVRFVFIQRREEYLKLNRKPDVISKTYDEDGVPCPAKGCMIDVEGFDVYKFLGMIQKSNPTVIEWLNSSICYYGLSPLDLKKIVDKHLNTTALYFHYKSMGRTNYLKYIKSNQEVTYKKYLYAMRGIINAKYVVEYGSFPSVDFIHTLEVVSIVPKYILDRVRAIISLKKQGMEKSIIQNKEVKFDEYIEEELRSDSEHPIGKKSFPVDKLNRWLLRQFKEEDD